MAVHPLAQGVVDSYLAATDVAIPARIEGLYLVGSVALDDFQPRSSDIDFVAVTAEALSQSEIARLERVHQELAKRRPHFDGVYVTWQDLSIDPSLATSGTTVHEGRLRRRGVGRCDPVTWHTLADHGIAIRGPGTDGIAVWTNEADLAVWTLRNLDEYWTSWLSRSARLLSGPGLACLRPWGPAWGVLGVSRQHYTLATGAITSKSGAGRYAREAFEPRWSRIVDECLRLRSGVGGPSLYRDPFTRRRAALDFVAMAIDDAKRT